MFHVKRFDTIGAKNLKKPHPANGLSACANARQTCLIGAITVNRLNNWIPWPKQHTPH
jgi:hypothetical protein